MENTYLTALHGMESIFENMDALLNRFHKKFYMDAFNEFYESQFAAFQALEDGYHNAIEKEQFIANMANAVVDKAVKILASVTRKAKKSEMAMNLNLFMVVYVLPAFGKYDGECVEPMKDRLLSAWKEKFPESNISAANVDEIQSGFQHKWCYITTAVCETFGKPDDCYELTLLRNYRDTYLMEQEDGEAIIHEYYDVAPTIVKHINHSDRKEEVYRHIWDTYLNPCIHMIETDRMQECRELYIQMVHDLEEEYFYTYPLS